MKDLDVSYLRVSTPGQVERESIASQRHALNLYFEQRQIKTHFQFEDDGVSGGTELHRRPQGSELYRLVAEGRVSRLFTFALDRIGRDTVDTLLFLRLAESRNTRIVGISDNTDTAREGSTLEIEIKSVIASQYRRDRMRQSKAGLRRRASEGKINNRPPFGFVVEDGRLVEDVLKAPVMREIFERVGRGERTRDIVQYLNATNAPSPSNRRWRHDTLIYLLKHPAYKGTYECCVTPKRRAGGGPRIKRDPTERITINCPAIVSRDLFDAVQERVRFNRHWVSTSRKNFYLLRSLIRCGRCGRAYVGHTISGRRYGEKQYPNVVYYECGTLSNRDYEFCGNIRVNARRLEAVVWNEIEHFLSSPTKTLEAAALSYNAQANSSGESGRQRQKKLETLRRKNVEARDRLVLAVARGVVSEMDALRARDTLMSEAQEIDKQLRDLEDVSNRRASERRRLFGAESLLRTLRARLDQGVSLETKAELVRCLVRQILVERNTEGRPLVTVNYDFKPSFSFSAVGSALSASS